MSYWGGTLFLQVEKGINSVFNGTSMRNEVSELIFKERSSYDLQLKLQYSNLYSRVITESSPTAGLFTSVYAAVSFGYWTMAARALLLHGSNYMEWLSRIQYCCFQQGT